MSWFEQLPGRPANWDQALFVALACYALGCLTGGYYLVRWRTGRDVRTLRTGTVGARNVGAVLGPTGFVTTVLWDAAKGGLAVWVVLRLTADERLAALALLAVVIGHIWPAQLRFHGGKGVATSLGALLLYDWQMVLAYAVCFLVPFVFLRKTVLPGLIAFASLPLVSLMLQHDSASFLTLTLLAAIVLIAHRKNLAEEFSALATRTEHGVKTDKS